jgi:hypothetical protein
MFSSGDLTGVRIGARNGRVYLEPASFQFFVAKHVFSTYRNELESLLRDLDQSVEIDRLGKRLDAIDARISSREKDMAQGSNLLYQARMDLKALRQSWYRVVWGSTSVPEGMLRDSLLSPASE